jgi:hypothetical protein
MKIEIYIIQGPRAMLTGREKSTEKETGTQSTNER